jgi:hypothetical protein
MAKIADSEFDSESQCLPCNMTTLASKHLYPTFYTHFSFIAQFSPLIFFKNFLHLYVNQKEIALHLF